MAKIVQFQLDRGILFVLTAQGEFYRCANPLDARLNFHNISLPKELKQDEDDEQDDIDFYYDDAMRSKHEGT